MTSDEKRTAFLKWLAAGGDAAKGAKGTEARAGREAMADLARLVGRKHWEHVPQCFAALRYDFGRAPDDEYAAAYDRTLDEAEGRHYLIETGRPLPGPISFFAEGGE